jgi:hypothetical protein
MATPHTKSGEALFIVILRGQNAKAQLTTWLSANKNAQARIDDHRMYIMDQNTLNLFTVSWTQGWDEIVIWDTWNRRHI